ncbi:MAG TPA: dolichyl-phosphate beta-glucosyltransferase [Planctomycetota bacterium]|nr:dolichyl-phosphate beta-glucosyltransferase [Planctomycetota bacterium]
MISVVVPAFNEEAVLAHSLSRLCRFLAERGEPFEVLVVDDGSADRTAAVAEARAREDPRLRLLRLARNRGKGAAVREGVRAARGDFVFFLDADLSTPPEAIETFLPALHDGAGVVLGSRRIAGSVLERRQPRAREVLGKGFTWIARALVAPGVRDFTCGFKGFSAAACREIFARQTVDRWAFDAEIVAIARARGIPIREVPVRWTNDPDTKVRLGLDLPRSLLEILRIAARRLLGRYRR